MINRLKKKFVFINMILILIILIFTFSAVYISTNNRLIKENNDMLQKTIEQENEIYKPQQNVYDLNINSPPPPQIFTFAVQLDKNNKIINIFYNNTDKLDTNTLSDLVRATLDNDSITGSIQDKSFIFLKHTNESGIKIAFADRSSEINTLNSLIRTSILVGIGSLIAFFAVSIYLANWAVKPIKKSWDQQRQFVADASHELKTPLTVILANTDIILSHKEHTINDQIKWINYIKTEAERMSSLVNNLLFLAKTDGNKNQTIFSNINFSDILWNCVLSFESIAFEEDKIINTDISSDVFINGDTNKLKQLIVILIDNAIKYSNKKGTINILLKKSQDKAYFSVNNTGNTIPEDKIPHLFERFYRIDESRAREKDGYGLGLSIAKAIADSHNVKINVKSSETYGTTFSINFPVKIKI